MSSYVVDTNVAIVANIRNTHADEECRLQCIEELEAICSTERVVVLDEGRLIFDEEYKKYLNFAGEPGGGDKFFKHVHDHM